MTDENKINKWFYDKTKLYERTDLDYLNEYISSIIHLCKIEEIFISYDYKFNFISSSFKNIRFENIFKLNWMIICDTLKDLFPKINILCEFEKSSFIDSEIQKGNATFKHDIYISICNPNNNRMYDCVIEYFEEKSHKRKPIDCDKELYVQQMVDYYIVYREESNTLNKFFLDTIHKVMLLICASSDDPYTLSKINFFKNSMNESDLKNNTHYFNNIMKYHKNNHFNFEKFFIELRPKNLETEDKFEIQEFIDYFRNEHQILINPDEKGNCDYSIFEDIILFLDINMSHRLGKYKRIYSKAMLVMLNSQKEIIHHINEVNNKKRNLPEFLDTFIRNHLQNYRKPFTLKKAFDNLNK
jgi:hypothetical protein